MAYEAAPLPYPYDALEPHIDTRTMEIHHDKHHVAYVTNVNKALEGHADLAAKPIEQLLREIKCVPENIRQAVINHGGGHANHTLFWKIMGSKKGGQPKGRIADDIKKVFGGFDPFKEEFTKARTSEKLESLISILIGINVGNYGQELQDYQQKTGMDHYIDVGDATPRKLAKLAAFVSQSISSQSQALGTGGPSQNIAATI